MSFGEPMRKMGQRAIVCREVFFDDVFVPEPDRLGGEGQGFYGLMGTFDISRVVLGAAASARRARRTSTRWSTPRRASSSASRSSSTRPWPSGSPTWPPGSRRRG